MHRIKQFIVDELEDYNILLNNCSAVCVALFVTSVILMNFLANKEIAFNVNWFALDCGLIVSWLSFLSMDMITKHYGPKAAIKISLFAVEVNLLVCLMYFLVSKIPGNWSMFYNFDNNGIINEALNGTIGGTWYILVGSTVAFIVSSVVNAFTNYAIGTALKESTLKSYIIRSNLSTLVGQFIDNFVFSLIVSKVFFGWNLTQCLMCSLTGCILETIMEFVFTPIGFKVCQKWEERGVGSNYFEYLESKKEEK